MCIGEFGRGLISDLRLSGGDVAFVWFGDGALRASFQEVIGDFSPLMLALCAGCEICYVRCALVQEVDWGTMLTLNTYKQRTHNELCRVLGLIYAGDIRLLIYETLWCV